MEARRQAFPIDIHTGWVDFSPALHSHVTQTVGLRLERSAPLIRSIAVHIRSPRLSDLEARVCAIDVALNPSGSVSASATGTDLFEIVNRASERLRVELEQHVSADAGATPLLRTA
jgi:ribosome-associated translation inhibitor RaiA